MPQVAVDATGGEPNIPCETVAENTKGHPLLPERHDVEAVADIPPDLPPESFWLSKDAELDWLDRNAFYERNQSTKGSSQAQPSSNSSSQRFSLNLTSTTKSIFGLAKTPKANKQTNTKSIPKRTEWVDKQAGPMTEPSSPKVSCMGRVRSIRRSRSSTEPVRNGKPVERSRSTKTGSCSGFMSMFKSGKNHKKPIQKDVGKTKEELTVVEEAVPKMSKSASRRAQDLLVNIEPVTEPPRLSKSASKRAVNIEPVTEPPRLSKSASRRAVNIEPVTEPPSLGGMKRFASGRRSTDQLWGPHVAV